MSEELPRTHELNHLNGIQIVQVQRDQERSSLNQR